MEPIFRLYETQVKKIIKVQCMMRAFLARRRIEKNKPKKPGEGHNNANSFRLLLFN